MGSLSKTSAVMLVSVFCFGASGYQGVEDLNSTNATCFNLGVMYSSLSPPLVVGGGG